jgi:hypothetical protein
VAYYYELGESQMSVPRIFASFLILLVAFAPTTARSQEMAILASALEICALDTTYYVPLEALNDVSDPNAVPAYDYIDHNGGTYVIKPWEGCFRPSRVALTTAFFPWRGPYVTFQPGRTQIGTSPYDEGSPLDPWGNPYLFFSPLGLLRGDTGSLTLEYYGDQFDRYAIVSFGPDVVKSADDLIYFFGGGVTSSVISSLRGPTTVALTSGPFAADSLRASQAADYRVVPGAALTIRGVNLFSNSGESSVYWGATQLSDVVSTNTREITVAVPQGLDGIDDLRIVIPGVGQTNAVRVQLLTMSDAALWALYE